MSQDAEYNWPNPFLGRIGNVLARISIPFTFLGMMYAACNSAGWVVGIALGWIPAFLVTAIVAGIVYLFWWVGVLVVVALVINHYA